MEGLEKKANWALSLAGVVAAGVVGIWVQSAMKDLDIIPILQTKIASLESKASGARFTADDGAGQLERIHDLEVRVSVLEYHRNP